MDVAGIGAVSFSREVGTSWLRTALNSPDAEFRAGQWEVIESVLQGGGHHLLVQRTGWGKSLIYFIVTRVLRNAGTGPSLVISPLLALMRDQLRAAARLGLVARTINSSNKNDWPEITEGLIAGQVDILFISPERLANVSFRRDVLLPLAPQCQLLVVDEAHCVSDWGHDFRPDYQRVAEVIRSLPTTSRTIAATATANNRVVEDVKGLFPDGLRVHRGPLVRASLHLQNISLPHPLARYAWLAAHLQDIPGTGIIYTLPRRDAVLVSSWLKSRGISAEPYVGGVNDNHDLERALLENEVKCLVATSALGMGFDKPDLGFVIHFQRPQSVVHYYQQVGRAGRAVESALGIMLGGAEDNRITDFFIKNSFPSPEIVEELLGVLDQAGDTGFSIPDLEDRVNIARGRMQHALKWLSIQTPTPVLKSGSRWLPAPVHFEMPFQQINRLAQQRREEQSKMDEYLQTSGCLMEFLQGQLDDLNAERCGRCASCVGHELVSSSFPEDLVNEAALFIRRGYLVIEPRKQWPGRALEPDGPKGRIHQDFRAQEGRALCHWTDPVRGASVRTGKTRDLQFSDELVMGLVEVIRHWGPEPRPNWVTCVPSLRTGELVPALAEKVAGQLGLPFIRTIQKLDGPRQATCQNSPHQARNAYQSYRIIKGSVREGPVFLVDDLVDSGWTYTVLAYLQRQAGSGPVIPLALADTSASRIPFFQRA